MARVVVTRPAGQEAALVDRLVALGHEVEHIPLIEIELLGDDPIDVSPYDWIVLTSANGARALRRRMVGKPRRVAAIGRATADAFGHVDLIAEVSTQEGLLAELPPAPGRVLFAAAEGARSVLPAAIGAEVVCLYRTRQLTPPPFVADLVVVASPSAARALAEVTREIAVVSIGPESSAVARERGLCVVAEAETHDLVGLVAAVSAAAS
jgi:uroporphyrinogen-III synthase